MSWSQYRFLHIPLLAASSSTQYRLLKFSDSRDGRFSHLAPRSRERTLPVVDGVNWCRTQSGNRGHVVLYIPGHDGSYLQARSIGAHGIQLAQSFSSREKEGTYSSIRTALMEGEFSGMARDLENFVMDVYTVDFDEEGGALHASRLWAQADFVVHAIQELGKVCGVNDGEGITIVAHSVGGLVARRAVGLLNQLTKEDTSTKLISVNAVVTLASPHVLLPFAFESSMWHYYISLRNMEETFDNSTTTNTPFLSISGGLRDELIPGELCSFNANKPVGEQAFLSSNFMEGQNGPDPEIQLGVDHKAITWCYSILNVVREIIHSTVQSSSLSTTERQEIIDEMLHSKTVLIPSDGLKHCDYSCELSRQEKRFMDTFGYWKSKTMKTAMIYNCQLFAVMYATIGIFCLVAKSATIHWMDQSMRWTALYIGGVAVSLVMTVLLRDVAIFQPKDGVVKVALAMMTMNLYCALLFGLIPLVANGVRIVCSLCHRGGQKESKNLMSFSSSQLLLLAGTGTIYATCFGLWMRFNHRIETIAINPMAVGSHLYILLVLMILSNVVYLSCCPPCQPNKDSKQTIDNEELRRMILSLFIPMLPLLVIGKVVFAWSLLTLDGQVKASPFLNFEHDRWVGSHCAFKWSCLVGRIFQHDLVRSTAFICLPTYLILLHLQYRLKGRREIENAKTKKSH